MLNSTTLQQVMHRWLRNPELLGYLQREHSMEKELVNKWIDSAVHSLMNRGQFAPALHPRRKQEKFTKIVNQVSRIPLFKGLPPEDLALLSSSLLHRQFDKGQTLYNQGELADRMFILERGEISLIGTRSTGRAAVKLGPYDAFGAFSFISGARHAVSAVTTTPTEAWVLRRSEFFELIKNSQIFKERLKQYLRHDSFITYLHEKTHFSADKVERFLFDYAKAVDDGRPLPEAHRLSMAVGGHEGAAIAIWLGILLDGIPESLVIGSSMIHSKVSISLLVGLFIANFPESLSSSLGMRQQGLSSHRIVLMWGSIVLITGVGAAIGNTFFSGAEPVVFTLVEGIAAGAMLTMIAQTMLPEAYFKGGSIVGFATLLGFLAAIMSKTLE
jgi:zinc transporter ZupT